MDPATLKGVAIVSMEGAARLGRVKEVLFATDPPLRVAALQATDKSGESVVPFERVSSFGSDAVMVETPDVSEHAPQPSSPLRSLADLLKLKVVDQSGAFVGTVKSLDFDPDTGRVERLVAAAGGVLGMGGTSQTVEAVDIRSVGDDLLTISSDASASAPLTDA